MPSFWLVMQLLLFNKAQNLEFARLSIWKRIMALTNPETRSYLLMAARLLLLLILVHSTLPWHIFSSINTGITYYAWALLRAQLFTLLLLSTGNFARDHLRTLPNELLHQVFRYAEPDLHSLSLVSRRFHNVTEDMLYRNIRLVKEPRENHSHPLLLFMRTIGGTRKSQLVRSLELSSYQMGFEAGDHRSSLGIFAGREERAIAGACAHYVMSEPFFTARLAWSQELKAGTLDAFAHLLLCWLPNLSSISLQGYTWNKGNFLTLVTQGAAMQTRFLHLTHLDLRCKVDVHERRATKLTLQQFTQVLRIPSLRHLAVDLIESETILWPYIDVDPSRTSALTSLDVTLLHEQNLEKVLYLLPQLQKLHWTFWLNYKRPLWPSNLVCNDLATSLSTYVNTLQEMRIIPSHGFGRQWRISKVVLQGTLDLSAFHSLHTLEIPFCMLFGRQEEDRVVLAERLPHSLEHLILVDNSRVRHNSGRWSTITLLNVLRPYLINIIHGQDTQWKLKKLTSRIYVDSEGKGVVFRDESAPWRKKFHTELRAFCDLVGVRFIGD